MLYKHTLSLSLQIDEVIWEVDDSVRAKRLPRFTVPLEEQVDYESAKLWRKVGAAIDAEDQVAATEEKFVLEERQRNEAKQRKADEEEWMPKFFQLVSHLSFLPEELILRLYFGAHYIFYILDFLPGVLVSF